MLKENKINFDTLKNALEGVLFSYENGEKSKNITVGLHLNLKTGKVEGLKFFVGQGVNTVLGTENLKLAIERYNAIKIDPETVSEATDTAPVEVVSAEVAFAEEDHGTIETEIP